MVEGGSVLRTLLLVPHVAAGTAGLVLGPLAMRALVTAFLVVNWSSPLAWFLPTLLGAPLIGRATARARKLPVAAAGG